MTRWWTAPVETRWTLLNWPGWSRLTVLAGFFATVNYMIFAPASSFKEVHQFLAHQDKIAHGAIFLTLAWLARWSLPGGTARQLVGAWVRYGVPAGLVLYACSAELLQPIVGGKGRTFEWLDMASNLAGLCSGWLLFGWAVARGGCFSAGRSPGVGAASLVSRVRNHDNMDDAHFTPVSTQTPSPPLTKGE